MREDITHNRKNMIDIIQIDKPKRIYEKLAYEGYVCLNDRDMPTSSDIKGDIFIKRLSRCFEGDDTYYKLELDNGMVFSADKIYLKLISYENSEEAIVEGSVLNNVVKSRNITWRRMVSKTLNKYNDQLPGELRYNPILADEARALSDIRRAQAVEQHLSITNQSMVMQPSMGGLRARG